MTTMTRLLRSAMLAGLLAATATGCKMDVSNPSVIDASTFDPTADAAALSLSAQTNLFRALSAVIHFSAFFSQEAIVGAVRQETNDIGRRVMTAATSDVNTSLWVPLQRAIATNELAAQVLEGGSQAAADINLGRAYMNSGFSLVLLAEHFCEGTMLAGPPMTPTELLETAVDRFTKAIAIGAAVPAANAEGAKVVSASNVGLARARLQRGDNAGAATAAALVPAGFVYNALAVDDPSNRALGNGVFAYDLGRLIVVPEAYRALADPRVPWQDGGANAQDTQFRWFQQLKYTGYASPMRVASGLEAQYIAAEARLKTGTPDAALALIAAQRAANGQPEFTGSGADVILAELMNQRAREFWLEAKKVGDARRNPAATPFVGEAGTPFYKPAQGVYGNATCLPVPLAEVNANPNFPK